jgi:hypothetical protein
MTPPFSVRTSPHFDRLAEALTRRQPDFPARYDRAREILDNDPYNRTRRHHIKKLEGSEVCAVLGRLMSRAGAGHQPPQGYEVVQNQRLQFPLRPPEREHPQGRR